MFVALERAKSKACKTLFILLVMPRVAQFPAQTVALN